MGYIMKTFLIIGGHDEAYSYLKDMGIDLVIIQIPTMLGEEQKKLAKEIIIVESLTNDSVLKSAIELHKKYNLDYIFSFTEDGLLPAAFTAKSLGIPGIDYDSCLLCRDKTALRQYLKNSSLAVPAYLCDNEQDLIKFIENEGTSVVLKDPMGSGSKHVIVCNDQASAIKGWNTLRQYGCNNILAEKFLEGTEYSIETMTLNGKHECLGITQKVLYPGTVIEQQHIFPAPDLDPKLQHNLATFAVDLLLMIKHRHGPCHIEVIVNDNNISLVEINNRGGGDFIWQMVLLVRGVDVIRETLTYAFLDGYDEDIRIKNKRFTAMSSIALFAPLDAQVLRAQITEEVDIVRLSCRPNTKQNIEVKDSWDRFGFLVIGHDNKDEFQRLLPKVVQKIHMAEQAAINEIKHVNNDRPQVEDILSAK